MGSTQTGTVAAGLPHVPGWLVQAAYPRCCLFGGSTRRHSTTHHRFNARLLPAADGYDVDYLRVPVTDEKAPKPSDFQLLIEVIRGGGGGVCVRVCVREGGKQRGQNDSGGRTVERAAGKETRQIMKCRYPAPARNTALLLGPPPLLLASNAPPPPPTHPLTTVCPQRCWDPPPGAALVFSCQMGRGRTTTGMVIASLLALRRVQPSLVLPAQPLPGLPDWFVAGDRYPSPSKVSVCGLCAGCVCLEGWQKEGGRLSCIRCKRMVASRRGGMSECCMQASLYYHHHPTRLLRTPSTTFTHHLHLSLAPSLPHPCTHRAAICPCWKKPSSRRGNSE